MYEGDLVDDLKTAADYADMDGRSHWADLMLHAAKEIERLSDEIASREMDSYDG
jgi:hypothetical protein